MADWLKFNEDFDYRWPNRSVTAFKKGMIVYVKDEVMKAATAAKVATKTTKPDDAEPGYAATPSRLESRIKRLTGNPVRTNRPERAEKSPPAPPVPADASGVKGSVLSPASGGEPKAANVVEPKREEKKEG